MKNSYITSGDITLILMESKGIPMFSVIDTADLPLLREYSAVCAQWGGDGKRCYARANKPTGKRGGSAVTLHRVIASPGERQDVDHINHFTLDNRRSNLRSVAHSVNLFNRAGAECRSASGVRGVYWCDRKNRWRAHYRVNGKSRHVGYFSSKHEAENAVVAARALVDSVAAA